MRLHQQSLGKYKNIAGFLTETKGGPIFSAETIEAILKATIENGENRVTAVRRALNTRFSQNFSVGEVSVFLEVLDNVNNLSPGLLLKERVNIKYGNGASGIVSVDFKGQNARNLEENFRSIMESRDKSLSDSVRAIREGEIRATKRLDDGKGRFQKVFGDVQLSGDDGIYLPPKALSKKEKNATIDKYLTLGDTSDIRLTFVDSVYTNGVTVPEDARSILVVEAEKVEKYLRQALLEYISRQELNDLMIAVNLRPHQKGGGEFGIFLRSRDQVTPEIQSKVLKVLEQKNIHPEFIDLSGPNPAR